MFPMETSNTGNIISYVEMVWIDITSVTSTCQSQTNLKPIVKRGKTDFSASYLKKCKHSPGVGIYVTPFHLMRCKGKDL